MPAETQPEDSEEDAAPVGAENPGPVEDAEPAEGAAQQKQGLFGSMLSRLTGSKPAESIDEPAVGGDDKDTAADSAATAEETTAEEGASPATGEGSSPTLAGRAMMAMAGAAAAAAGAVGLTSLADNIRHAGQPADMEEPTPEAADGGSVQDPEQPASTAAEATPSKQDDVAEKQGATGAASGLLVVLYPST